MHELLAGLTEEQQAVVTHLDGPLLVVAGAGTGKTKAVTHRIAYMIQEKGIAPESIVALTFTEKAATEMEERLDQLLPYGTFGVTTATFHGFCNELVRRHSYKIGVDPNARLISDAEQVSLLRANLSRLPLSRFHSPYNPVYFLRDLIKFIEKAKEEQLTPEILITYAQEQLQMNPDEAVQEKMEELLELSHSYAAALTIYHKANILTYADLLRHSLTILKTSASARAEEQERCHYLLIDEYQDTNTVQSEIAHLLVGKHHNICVVGDDDQSIYRFRGANVTNILSFRDHYPAAEIITLTENFRSGQPILDAAYRLIQHNNPYRLEVRERINKELHANKPCIDPVIHQQYSTSSHESEGVASTIQELINQGYAPSDIAILAKAHNHLDSFEQELTNLGIPVARSKESKFYQEPSVEQALSFLRFLVHPSNSTNLFFLLAGTPFHVPAGELRDLNIQAKRSSNSLWHQLQEEQGLSAVLQEAVRYLQEELHTLAGTSPTQALRSHIFKSGWQKQLEDDEQVLAATHLNTLYYQAQSYERLHRPIVLAQYLNHVDGLIESGEDVSVESELMAEGDGVKLMTIHGSKGLQFPVVFMVSCVMRRFPRGEQTSSIPIPAELMTSVKDMVLYEEERRLAYVAMTRAEQKLYFTAADRYGSNKTVSRPSIFILEALGGDGKPAYSDRPLRGGLGRTASVTTEAQLTVPKRITASMLEAFEDNPREYYRQHVLHLIAESPAAADFGTCAHSVLRSALISRKEGGEFQLKESYDRFWVGEGFDNAELRDTQYTRGLESLDNYLSSIPANHELADLELPIELKLSMGYTISGKIDRIDRNPDGSLSIIDYKTGNKEAAEADVKKNLPLLIYAAALLQKHERVRDISLHYLMNDHRPVVTINQAFIEQGLARIKSLLTALETAYATGEFPEKKKW